MTFDPIAALSAAKLCQRAYEGANVKQGSAQALVIYSPLRVAIAGTNDRADILDDARANSEPLGYGAEVHAGFLRHYRAIIAELTAAMTAKPVDEPPLLTGHSLGAACAVLTVWHRPYLFKGGSLYLFGCPAGWNGNFAAMFDRLCRDNSITVWNVQGDGDTVCIRPLRREHVGQVVEIGGGWDMASDHRIAAYVRDLEDMTV
jgi:hypothetical protein